MLIGDFVKSYSLLNPDEKKHFFGVFFLTFLSTVVDTAGILSIFPLLQIVLNPEIIQQNSYLKLCYDFFGFGSDRSFLLACALVLLAFFIGGNIIKGWALWFGNHFTYSCNRRVSRDLMMFYYRESYLENIKKNSAQVASHLLTNVDLGISTILNSWIGLTSSFLLVAFLLATLFVTQPGAALFTFGVVGAFYYVIDRTIKSRIVDLGRNTVKNSTAIYKNINEATGGMKEIKYLGRTAKVLDDFDFHYKEYVDLKSRNNLYQIMPKLVIDVLAFSIGILGIVVYLGGSSNLGQTIPWMGLFGFTVLRIVPHTQQILQYVSKLRYSHNALQLVYADFKRSHELPPFRPVPRHPVTFKERILIKDISFSYKKEARPVLDRVSLEIEKGKMIAFVGKSGSGKTTLVDILLGLITPDAGSISVDGRKLDDSNMSSWQQRIGYVPQFVFLADDTVSRNVAFGVPDHEIDHAAVIDACQKANIHTFITDKLSSGYDTIVGERGVQLSGGQRQRLGIARALYHNPEIIILDEATSALDNHTELGVMDEINKIAGIKTIIIVAHRLSTVEKCDEIFLLENGKLLNSGTYPEMVLKAPDFFPALAMGAK